MAFDSPSDSYKLQFLSAHLGHVSYLNEQEATKSEDEASTGSDQLYQGKSTPVFAEGSTFFSSTTVRSGQPARLLHQNSFSAHALVLLDWLQIPIWFLVGYIPLQIYSVLASRKVDHRVGISNPRGKLVTVRVSIMGSRGGGVVLGGGNYDEVDLSWCGCRWIRSVLNVVKQRQFKIEDTAAYPVELLIQGNSATTKIVFGFEIIPTSSPGKPARAAVTTKFQITLKGLLWLRYWKLPKACLVVVFKNGRSYEKRWGT